MEHLLMPYTAVDHIAAKRALVFAPHPDDEVFGCGGAILRAIQAGIPVQVIVVSNGAYGAANTEERQKYMEIRRQESLAAAEILGYGIPIFWNYEDRDIVYCEQLIEEILTAIKEYQADVVYAPSILEMHSDHRSLAMAVLEAARRSETDLSIAMYEVGMPMRPNTLLDITSVWQSKQKAMACFTSQLKIQAYDEHITGLNRYRSYTLSKEVKYAEAYYLVNSRNLQKDFLFLYTSEYERQAKLPIPLPAITEHWPKVSVLIRSMDRPELQKALDSIALQTYANIEVIVVNAKGTGHRSLLDRYGRFPLIFVHSDVPLRRAEAANLALKHATGDYLIFLDDDDLFLPDHIYTLVSTLLSQPDKKVAYTKIQCMDAVGNRLKRIFDTHFDNLLLLAGNYIPIHAAMFSRALVESGCKMDEAFDLYEDWDFWIQASQHTDFIFISKVTAYYRISDTSGAGIRPEHTQQHQAGHQLFQKWRNLWTKEVLEYVISRIGMQHLNAAIIQGAQNALCEENQTDIKIAVVLHLFYKELWPEIREYLKNIPYPFDLIVTLPHEKAATIQPLVRTDYANARLIPLENRGRDILPFITVLPELIQKNYTCVCKIHTKKSHDAVNGNIWRRDMLESLLGNSDIIKDIVERFKNNTTLGLSGPQKHLLSCAMYPDSDIKRLLAMAERLLPGITKKDWHFFSGSMFWFRPAALLPILEFGLKLDDFEAEEGQKEGTLAHIVERLFTICAESAHMMVQTIEDNSITDSGHYRYPFATQSIFNIIQEKNRLQIQLQHTESALKYAEMLANERLNVNQQLNQQLQQTENALKYAETLANERLNKIKIIKQHNLWKIGTKLKIIKDI